MPHVLDTGRACFPLPVCFCTAVLHHCRARRVEEPAKEPGCARSVHHRISRPPRRVPAVRRGARNRANACAALFAASPDIAAVGASAELGDAPSSATAAAPHDSGDGHNPTADRDGTARVVFAVGFENGLVSARELGRSDLPDESWLDGGVVAVRQLSAPGAASHELRVRQGTFVLTEFHASPDADGATFDAAAASYRALIMPRIHAGEDLFKGWTRDWDGGPFTRDYFLTQVRWTAGGRCGVMGTRSGPAFVAKRPKSLATEEWRQE